MAADVDELVDELEAELGDSSNALLSAAEYQVHLQRAIGDLNLVKPREEKETLSTTEGSRELDLTDLTYEVLELAAVEYPVDEQPRRYVQFSVWGDTLEMLIDEEPGDSEDVDVYYYAPHVVDGSGSTLAVQYDQLVVKGGAGYAARQIAAELQNTATITGARTVKEWRDYSNAALREFRQRLRDLGAVLKVRRLFTPAAPAQADQETVQWEP